jgi:hypothetical protein
MAFPIKDVRAVVKHIEQNEKYAELRIDTWDKQQDGTYKYSNWSFVRFVGKANTFVLEEVEVGDTISINFGKITRESWKDKKGNRLFPKSERITVFTAEMFKKKSEDNGKADTKGKAPVLPAEDEFPFF